jgi:Uncharacterized protein conserved in bacteria (DUF2188)
VKNIEAPKSIAILRYASINELSGDLPSLATRNFTGGHYGRNGSDVRPVASNGADYGVGRMLGRHVYRVHPQGDEWAVSKDGEEAPRGNFVSRDAAVAEALRLARSDQPARVMIDNRDGAIAEERLVGADPSDQLQP